jgi:integrase
MKPIQQNKTAWVNAKETVKIKGQCRWHDLRHTGLTWVLLGDPDRSPEENEKMIRPPMKVSAYCGASMKTIEKVYLKKRASHTADVSGAISIF